MLKAGASQGYYDEREAVLEAMTSIKRAGAEIIVTYWARELAGWTQS
jgi:porphobilinogen synthase